MPDKPDPKNSAQVSFLQRWSQRKSVKRAAIQTGQSNPRAEHPAEHSQAPPARSLPSIESLHEGSDFGMFLADDVSEALQRQALRKLFHFQKFNICDGLDDYAEDYTIFKPLEKLLDIKDRFQDVSDRVLSTEVSDANDQAGTKTCITSAKEDEDEMEQAIRDRQTDQNEA